MALKWITRVLILVVVVEVGSRAWAWVRVGEHNDARDVFRVGAN